MTATSLLTLRLSPATQKRLTRLAESVDRTKSKVAAEAIEKYLDDNEWQVEAIKEGIADLDQGRVHSHESVLGWIETVGKKPKRANRR